MSFVRKVRVGPRLLIGFGSVVTLLVVIVAVGWSASNSSASTARNGTDSLHWYSVRVSLELDALNVAQYANNVGTDYAAGFPAADDVAFTNAAIQAYQKDYATATSDSLSSDESALLDKSHTAFNQYVTGFQAAQSQFAAHTAGSGLKAAGAISQLDQESVLSPLADLAKNQLSEVTSSNSAAVSSADSSALLILILGGLALAAAIVLALLIIGSIVGPLRAAVKVLDRSAEGDLTVRADDASGDELGRLASSLNRQLEATQSMMTSMRDMAHRLTSASAGLGSISTQLASGAEETSAQAATVSVVAEQVASNVSTVAAASEELSASIREIARSATEATHVVGQGLEVTHTTTETVSKLRDSSTRIGEVVGLITSIAEQTNLLSLNATIEAARAGEAGRGFSIVANEVKDLAQRTSAATGEISSIVEAIQVDAQEVIVAITRIDGIMEEISHAQTTIASAVEEQTATTAEIGRTVAEASTGSGGIASSISGVAVAARDTSGSAAGTQTAAGDLSHMAADLTRLVDAYRF
jgi:methyl-accepting chemotaxis protein